VKPFDFSPVDASFPLRCKPIFRQHNSDPSLATLSAMGFRKHYSFQAGKSKRLSLGRERRPSYQPRAKPWEWRLDVSLQANGLPHLRVTVLAFDGDESRRWRSQVFSGQYLGLCPRLV
jgi:hypothetical protein